MIKKRILKFIILLIFALANVMPCYSQNKENIITPIETVTYETNLQADLFKNTREKNIPAIILVHGGYWTRGKRQDLSNFASKLADNGYLAMTIDYNLLPKYGQKEQTQNIANAVWWLRENSDKLGINPNKIGIAGISSGGYHAAWAVTHDIKNQNGYSSKPNAGVILYGPWDLTKVAEKEINEDSIKLINTFCNGVDRKEASPMYSITKNTPPLLIIHGNADKVVPVSQSINAYKELRNNKCKCNLIIVKNDGHCYPNTESYFNAVNKSVIFFNKILK